MGVEAAKRCVSIWGKCRDLSHNALTGRIPDALGWPVENIMHL